MFSRLSTESASAFHDVILKTCQALADTFILTWSKSPHAEQVEYCSALNCVMADIHQTILWPLYAQFPHLDVFNLTVGQSCANSELRSVDSLHCELAIRAPLRKKAISDPEVSNMLIRSLSKVVADLEAAKVIAFAAESDDKPYPDRDVAPIEDAIASLYANLLIPLGA